MLRYFNFIVFWENDYILNNLHFVLPLSLTAAKDKNMTII